MILAYIYIDLGSQPKWKNQLHLFPIKINMLCCYYQDADSDIIWIDVHSWICLNLKFWG